MPRAIASGAPPARSTPAHRHDGARRSEVIIQGGGCRGIATPLDAIHEKRIVIAAGREWNHSRPDAGVCSAHRGPRRIPVVEVSNQRHRRGIRGNEYKLVGVRADARSLRPWMEDEERG